MLGEHALAKEITHEDLKLFKQNNTIESMNKRMGMIVTQKGRRTKN